MLVAAGCQRGDKWRSNHGDNGAIAGCRIATWICYRVSQCVGP